MTGNRCGHDRSNPRTRLARPERGNLPRILITAMARAEAIVSARGRKFPELGGRQLRLFGRERRSERLEAIALVAKALLCRMDLVSLRVGDITPGDRCRGIPRQTLAKWSALGEKRTMRALCDLRDAGYLTYHQPRISFKSDVGTPTYVALPAIRTFTAKFFRRAGLAVSLEIERKKAVKRRRVSPVVDYRARRELRRIAEQQRRASQAIELRVIKNEDVARQMVQLQLELRLANPTWSAEQVRAEARRRLE